MTKCYSNIRHNYNAIVHLYIKLFSIGNCMCVETEREKEMKKWRRRRKGDWLVDCRLFHKLTNLIRPYAHTLRGAGQSTCKHLISSELKHHQELQVLSSLHPWEKRRPASHSAFFDIHKISSTISPFIWGCQNMPKMWEEKCNRKQRKFYLLTHFFFKLGKCHCWFLYKFPAAAVTNEHVIGGLELQKCIFPQFWKPDVWSQHHWARIRWAQALSWGSREESFLGLSEHLLAADSPWLVATSLQPSRVASSNLSALSSDHLPLCVVKISLCSLL